MRVSTGMIYDSGLSSMQNRMSSLLQVQQQLSTGRRLLSPSDDPVAAARALEVTQSLAANKAQAETRNNVKSAVGIADAQLQSASDLLTRVRELTIQAGDAALSTQDRMSIALEMRQRFDELLAIANAKDGLGNSLFGGFQVGNKPFAGSVEDGVRYLGDDGMRALQVSSARQMGISKSGNDIFMRIQNGNGMFVTSTQNQKNANVGSATIDKGTVSDPLKWSQAANSGAVELRFWIDTQGTVETAGQAVGSTAAALPLMVVQGFSDTFDIQIDAGVQRTATILPGTYSTPGQIVDAVQLAIDNATPASPGSATVTLDADGRIVITSDAVGASSAIALTEGNGALARIAGTPTITPGSGATAGGALGSPLSGPVIPLTINAGTNDQFYVDIDGAGPQLITLTPGVYGSATGLQAEIQSQLAPLGAPYDAATVSVDTDGYLVITSGTPAGSVSLGAGVIGGTAVATDITFGAWTPAMSGATGVILADSGQSGAFDTVSLGGTSGTTRVDGLDAKLDFTATVDPGLNVQSALNPISNLDLSASGDMAQFDVTIGANTIGVTLASTYLDGADLAAAIESQVQMGAGDLAATTVTFSNGQLVFSNGGSSTPVEIGYADANAETTLGITNSAGLTGGIGGSTSFTIDGIPVVLDQVYVDNDAVALAIQTQLGAGYSVSWDALGTQYSIVNNALGSSAPTIVSTNAAAFLQGWDATANLTLTDGSAGNSYFLSIGVEGGGILPIFSQTGGLVTDADIDAAIASNAALLVANGISVAGTAQGGDLQFTNANGYDITIIALNGAGLGGFANVPFNTGGSGYTTDGANGTTDGVVATNGTPFSIDINGINLYSEPGTIGGTVTAVELDAALAGFLAANPEYTRVSGSFAGGDLRLTNSAGTGITFTINQFTGGVNPLPGALATTNVNDPGSDTSSRNALPLLFGSAPVASGNLITGSPLATPQAPLTIDAGANDQFTIDIDGAGSPQTITLTPGNYVTADDVRLEIQQQFDIAGVSAALSFDPSGNLLVRSNSTGATSSVTLGASPTPGRDGLGRLFGQPIAITGTDIPAGQVFYDLVDATTGNSLFTGTASTTGGAANTYLNSYSPPLEVIDISNAGGPGQLAFDFGASVGVSGIPADGDAFTITASTDHTGNGYFVTAAKTETAYNTGTGIVGVGDILNPAKWNHPANSRNLEVRFWQDPEDTGNPKTTYYDLVDAETEKSLFTDGVSVAGGASNSYTRVFHPGNAISFNGLNVPYGADTITDFGISVTVTGAPASGDAFKVRASESQSVFETLAKTIKLLETSKPVGTPGNVQFSNELGSILASLSLAEDGILSARAVFGSHLSEIDSLDSVGEHLNIQHEETLSRLQDLDYAEAITKLTRQQMELQAAQQSFSRISQLSLFDYLR